MNAADMRHRTRTSASSHPRHVAPPRTIVYLWTATDSRNRTMHGEMSGRNAAVIRARLRSMGMMPHTVREKPGTLFGIAGQRITSRDIALFSRQLATMMQAGVPLVQTFSIMQGSQRNARLRKVVGSIRTAVENGSSLHAALGHHPKQFDALYRNLVKAGETAGVLDDILQTIASYKERTEALKAKIRKALSYPLLVLATALIVTLVLLLHVVPVFASMFEHAGAELPRITQWIIVTSDFLQQHGWLLLLTFLGSSGTLLFVHRRSAACALAAERLYLRLPLLGRLLRRAAIARFTRTLAVTFRAGVPLVDALDIVSTVSGSRVYGRAIIRIRDDIAVGHSLQLALSQTRLFPPMVIQMAGIGEEAGALDDMLFKVADFYEEDVNDTVDNLASLLEPAIMIFLGVVVGGMVMALYLPIFKLATIV